MIAAVVVCGCVAFLFKEQLFAVILAPQSAKFVTYQMFGDAEALDVRLINTGLAQQFIIHVKVAFWAGIILTSPYLLYLLFHFISPALYQNERRCVVRLVFGGYVMFMLGVLLTYFLIFPLTYRFLGMYQVSEVVENTVTIDSYIDTLMMLCLAMGIVFEIPIVCWLLSRFGILNAKTMRHFRRHVSVAILIIAAIITPTSDAFTLFIVSIPMWLLYEASILIVKE